MELSLGKGDGCELPATAVDWLNGEPQPGLVLVEFADAYGQPHQLVGKAPTSAGPAADIDLPMSYKHRVRDRIR